MARRLPSLGLGVRRAILEGPTRPLRGPRCLTSRRARFGSSLQIGLVFASETGRTSVVDHLVDVDGDGRAMLVVVVPDGANEERPAAQ